METLEQVKDGILLVVGIVIGLGVIGGPGFLRFARQQEELDRMKFFRRQAGRTRHDY